MNSFNERFDSRFKKEVEKVVIVWAEQAINLRGFGFKIF
jgi:hypothetical protein